jgi:hypothetical protein
LAVLFAVELQYQLAYLKHTASLLLHCIFPLKSSAVDLQYYCSSTDTLLGFSTDIVLHLYCNSTAIQFQDFSLKSGDSHF